MHVVRQDSVWGEVRFSEEVFGALIESPAVQRLKSIRQAGASYYLYPGERQHTRFDHSLGTAYLLRALGAALEEQVAGLLHDVPHTAFSHTVDLVFPSEEYNYHEKFQEKVIRAGDIPEILFRFKISERAALSPDSYPLLEQSLPRLCADRVDYTLRDAVAAGWISADEARKFLTQLSACPAGICVLTQNDALWFARLFARANRELWTGVDEAGAYWALAQAVRRALQTGILTHDDLFSTDDAVMSILARSADPVIAGLLQLLRPGTTFRVARPGGPSFHTTMKNRFVDPPVLVPGHAEPVALSRVCEQWRTELRGISHEGRVEYSLWSDDIGPEVAEWACGHQG